MDLVLSAFEFIQDRPEQFQRLLEAHLRLSISALVVAFAIFMPIGVLCARWERIGSSIVGPISALRVIPSLALIVLLYPWLGFGFKTALWALVILAGPPILLNTFAGLRNVNASVLEAARGLGMNEVQTFTRVQLPLALPVIVAGIRTAAVEVIASATLASFVGVRTFGQWILTGISLLDNTYLLAGALPIMGLVLVAELLFGGLERLSSPRSA